MTLSRITLCICLSAVAASVAACREKSQLYCSTTQVCEVGLPVCDLEGICAASDHVANTCILEACWDAGPSSIDAAIGGTIDAPATDYDAGIDAYEEDCTQSLACPSAASGKSTICGVIENMADGKRVLGDETRAFCDSSAPTTTGPCAIQLTIFSALVYADNPGTATPLVPESVKIDGCGRYLVENVTMPIGGYLTLVADDYAGQDTFVATAGVLEVKAGVSSEFDLLMLDHETDERWTTTASAPFGGATFSQVGATLMLFRTLTGLQSGVQITRGGTTGEDDDYYFYDAVPSNRFQIRASQGVTGANGAGLIVDSNLEVHGGTGGAPDGCTWTGALGLSIPGVVFYFTSIAEGANGDPC